MVACWRIFSFQIHKRSPSIEKLYFHLPGKNSIIFEDDDDIDALLSKPTIKESMFTSWLQANSIFHEGKHLTYSKFIANFTYIAKDRLPPSTRELYYLRMMLVVVKRPTNYEQIRIVNGQLYPSFRETYFFYGLFA
ncbi:hypothetical protein HKD37_06G016047 [Glycine soja]